MNLKEKIELFLKARDKTLKDLAEYIDESEEDLNKVLTSSSVEIRMLEKISKSLRIPLFSFFHHSEQYKKEEIPYYDKRLPETEKEVDIKSKKEELTNEIEFLKIQLIDKEDILKKLK